VVFDITVESDRAGRALAQLSLERTSSNDVGLNVVEKRERVEEPIHALSGDKMPEEDGAAPVEAVGLGRWDAIDPRAHWDDVSRRAGGEAVPPVASGAGGLGELDPRVGAPAAQAVDAVVDASRHRPGPEALRHEVHRPQHHAARPAQSARGKPARARKWVEAEPRVDPRRKQRHERVQGVRVRRTNRQPNGAFFVALVA